MYRRLRESNTWAATMSRQLPAGSDIELILRLMIYHAYFFFLLLPYRDPLRNVVGRGKDFRESDIVIMVGLIKNEKLNNL